MLFRKIFSASAFCLLFAGQCLFAQIQLQGVVKNNGDEPVANALVEVIDQANANRTFSSVTNSEGHYSIDISTTGIGGAPGQKPGSFNLLQNYPNPFNPSTIISYEIPHPAQVRIEIYNVLGQKIKTLLDAHQTNLYGRIIWDGTNDQGRGVSAGVYFYTLVSEGQRITHKMLLLDGHLGNTAAVAASQQRKAGPVTLLKPQSFTFLLRVSGTDIETWEQHDVQITENKVIDVNVIRTVTDIDGNVYRTVKIGEQWWMAENLRVKHYRNGATMQKVTKNSQWSSLKKGALCSYDNNADNDLTYGLLYNWYAVNDTADLTPAGWRVPTDQDWQELERTLGIDEIQLDMSYWRGTDQGGKLKESGTTHWTEPNTGATNEYGFNALPGGYRNKDGSFSDINTNAFYWANALYNEDYSFFRRLDNSHTEIYREKDELNKGYSVRCVLYEGSPIVPALSSPADSVAGLYTTITLSWKISAGAEWYGLQVSTNPVFTDLVVNEDNLTTTLYFVEGLAEGTTYYWRVNASNTKAASVWSEYRSFTTAVYERGTVSDFDGNVYKTIKIGNQWWMAENLKVTHYLNGDEIPNLTDEHEWGTNKTGALCNYKNNAENNSTYGYLYNGHAVTDNRKIAPDGWKVPTDEEWRDLETFLGMGPSEYDSTWINWDNVGGKLREPGTLHWKKSNNDATNESGFTALPGGERSFGGDFHNLGQLANFWTFSQERSSSAFYRRLGSSAEVENRHYPKTGGFSVRLVKYAISPNAPIPVLIENGEIDVTKSPILRWQPANGALTYSLQVAMNPDFSTLIVNQSNIDSTFFQMINLLPGTSFYWRVNAKNTEGASPWSEPWSFTTATGTPVTGTVNDIDGNVYKTVRIGKQWWMAENLKTTHYRNGDPIPNVTDSTVWIQLFTGAMCNLHNDAGYVTTYGSLYNWFATVDERNLAPEGWHVPTDEDWKQLERHLGVDRNKVDYESWRGTNAAGMLKETGTTHWNEPNTGATNETGFTALSFGFRSYRDGKFTEPGTAAYFLTVTETDSALVVVRTLEYNSKKIDMPRSHKLSGFSVRCVKD